MPDKKQGASSVTATNSAVANLTSRVKKTEEDIRLKGRWYALAGLMESASKQGYRENKNRDSI